MTTNTHWTEKQCERLRACIKAGDTIAFWCSDAFGRPSNGGSLTIERAAPGVIHRGKGDALCEDGTLHATHQPHQWAGVRVWIVACREIVGEQPDKLGCREREIIGEVLPEEAIEASVACRLGGARANLSGANLSRANLYGAYLYGANLSGANLSRANLSGANLSRANLSRANLSGANLSGANLSGANLPGANLSGANLSGATLYVANLYGANLSGANLSGADLCGAYLTGADLTGADLCGAYLCGAYLTGADLTGADLCGAYRPQNDIVGWTADEDGRLGRS